MSMSKFSLKNLISRIKESYSSFSNKKASKKTEKSTPYFIKRKRHSYTIAIITRSLSPMTYKAIASFTNYLNTYAPDKFSCVDRKSTRLNSSHSQQSRMPSSA